MREKKQDGKKGEKKERKKERKCSSFVNIVVLSFYCNVPCNVI